MGWELREVTHGDSYGGFKGRLQDKRSKEREAEEGEERKAAKGQGKV